MSTMESRRQEALARAEAEVEEWQRGLEAQGVKVTSRHFREWLSQRHPSASWLPQVPPGEEEPAPPPSRLQEIRRKLVARWDDLPDRPKITEDWDEIEKKIRAVLALINWIDDHPAASLDDYREEMRRTKESHDA